MKLVGCILILVLISCGIEQDIKKEIRRSSQRCEQRIDKKISEIEEKYDNRCITKEDLLTVLKALQERETVRVVPREEVDAGFEVPEDPPFPDGF